MVYTYKRADSPYWWLQYVNPKTGENVQKSSKLRHDDERSQLKLAKRVNALEATLLQTKPRDGLSVFGAWVPVWLKQKYGLRVLTYRKYVGQWNWLSGFFRQADIVSPNQVLREHAAQFIEWRCSQKKEKSKRFVKRNTAISDLKLGSYILNEAINRGLIERNPWTRLGFEREEQGIKPELTDTEISACLKALDSTEWKPWMKVSFTIALHTGLRFSETAIPLRNIDFVDKTILIENPKGGKSRAFSIPIPDAIMPMLQDLRRSKAKSTWTIPTQEKTNRFTALDWRQFFDNLGFHHLSFHCLRVTFISRGCRAGIPENIMCRLVNHASKEIDRIYQRISVADVRQFANKIQFPKSSGDARA